MRKCGHQAGPRELATGTEMGSPGRSRQEVVTLHHGPLPQCQLKTALLPGELHSHSPQGGVLVGLRPKLHRVLPKCLPGLNLPSSGPASLPPSTPNPPQRPP